MFDSRQYWESGANNLVSGWRIALDSESEILDHLARLAPESGFMQSSFWAQFKESEGYEVTRLVYEQGGQIVGGASLLRFHLTGDSNFIFCPEGPILPWGDEPVVRRALQELIAFTREIPNALGLRIEPHLPIPLPRVIRNWADAPTDLTPAHTLTLDLTQTEDQLLASAHPKCRYNLRIADREQVQIEVVQDVARCHEFYRLLLETSGRAGFFCEPLGFFLNLMSTLFKTNSGQLLMANWNGQILAMIVVVYFGRRATYLYGASTSDHRNKMPSYPLHRAAMREARLRGCIEYDMYGVDAFERRDHLYAGITRFKKQWGGVVQQRIGARDYMFYDRLAELIVDQFKE